MPTKKGLLKSPKIKGSRKSTVIKDKVAEAVIDLGKRLEEIKKITVGEVYPYGASKRRLEYKMFPGKVKIKARGTSAMQLFCLYMRSEHDKPVVAKALDKLKKKNNW